MKWVQNTAYVGFLDPPYLSELKIPFIFFCEGEPKNPGTYLIIFTKLNVSPGFSSSWECPKFSETGNLPVEILIAQFQIGFALGYSTTGM